MTLKRMLKLLCLSLLLATGLIVWTLFWMDVAFTTGEIAACNRMLYINSLTAKYELYCTSEKGHVYVKSVWVPDHVYNVTTGKYEIAEPKE